MSAGKPPDPESLRLRAQVRDYQQEIESAHERLNGHRKLTNDLAEALDEIQKMRALLAEMAQLLAMAGRR